MFFTVVLPVELIIFRRKLYGNRTHNPLLCNPYRHFRKMLRKNPQKICGGTNCTVWDDFQLIGHQLFLQGTFDGGWRDTVSPLRNENNQATKMFKMFVYTLNVILNGICLKENSQQSLQRFFVCFNVISTAFAKNQESLVLFQRELGPSNRTS